MELDDLKNSWTEASSPADKKNLLTTETIEKMTHQGYKSRLGAVVRNEALGTLFSFGGAAYIAFHFSKLVGSFYQSIAIITAALLIIMPIMSLMLLSRLNSVGDVTLPFSETLKVFATQKLRFIRFQQASVVVAYVLIVFVMLLMPRFTGGRSIHENTYFWIIAIPVGFVFVYVLSRWVLRFYKKALNQAGELLKELE